MGPWAGLLVLAGVASAWLDGVPAWMSKEAEKRHVNSAGRLSSLAGVEGELNDILGLSKRFRIFTNTGGKISKKDEEWSEDDLPYPALPFYARFRKRGGNVDEAQAYAMSQWTNPWALGKRLGKRRSDLSMEDINRAFSMGKRGGRGWSEGAAKRGGPSAYDEQWWLSSLGKRPATLPGLPNKRVSSFPLLMTRGGSAGKPTFYKGPAAKGFGKRFGGYSRFIDRQLDAAENEPMEKRFGFSRFIDRQALKTNKPGEKRFIHSFPKLSEMNAKILRGEKKSKRSSMFVHSLPKTAGVYGSFNQAAAAKDLDSAFHAPDQ